MMTMLKDWNEMRRWERFLRTLIKCNPELIEMAGFTVVETKRLEKIKGQKRVDKNRQ